MDSSNNQDIVPANVFPLNKDGKGKARIEFNADKFKFISHIEDAAPIGLFSGDMMTLCNNLNSVVGLFRQTKNELFAAQEKRADDLIAGLEFTESCYPNKDVFSIPIQKKGNFEIRLEINVYNENVFLWLARYMVSNQDQKTYRCKGGSLLNSVDPAKLKKFAVMCQYL